MKKYSFVILTYNSEKTIKDCIQSVIDKTTGIEREIIVVDNDSKDGTVDFLKKEFAGLITLIENKKNTGFSGGMNVGLKKATGDYLIMLNPDAHIEKIDFDTIEKQFKKEGIGVIAPKIVWPDGTLQPSFGFYPTRLRLLLHFSKLQRVLPNGFLVYNNKWNKHFYKTLSDVDWASGCSLVIPKTVLEKIDYFDENFFLYVEDVDLCKRIKDEGYSIIVDPSIVISHILQASVKEDLGKNLDFQKESFEYFFKKHYNKNIKGLMTAIYALIKRKLPKK
ncbi:glycosyltransferase family 2 protein [Patescibacteria group bacterium]|nr:glycosyltransferase family 2 protein [Patescibacteria group bacterium]